MAVTLTPLKKVFDDLKKSQKSGAYSPAMINALSEAYLFSIKELTPIKKVQLVSMVQGKIYFAFEMNGKLSRPINEDLFNPDFSAWQTLMDQMAKNQISRFTTGEISKILYSAAISFCAVVDLFTRGDQKTPGTFFEYFAAFFFSWRLKVVPQASIQIQSLDNELSKLPTDYIFNLGKGNRKYHMPVKTSTRERAIMLWAHQKLIDGVYGNGRFMGTPVLLQETKLDQKNRQVVEICLPGQWQLYQLYIAKLTRIYYLDPPQAYLNLNTSFPPLYVKPFSDFFFEWDKITPL